MNFEESNQIDELCRLTAQAVLEDMKYLPKDRQNPLSTVCFDEAKENFIIVNGTAGCLEGCFRQLLEKRPELRGVMAGVMKKMYKIADW